jgi:kynurenine formamidase
MMISRKIKLGPAEYTVIDLTHPLKMDQEVYPGDSKPKRVVFSDIHEDGYHHYIHEIGDHHFQPHGDAPNHQNPELMHKGFEVFDLDYCFNPAFMIDLSNTKGARTLNGIRYRVETNLIDLLPFEGFFRQKSALLLRTGYDKWLEKNLPHDPEKLPYLSPDAAEFIASFENIKVVGTDSLTVDAHGVQESHKLLKDKFIVESMVHLHAIPVEHRENFDLQTTPLRIVGATGGPVVAYAFIPSRNKIHI